MILDAENSLTKVSLYRLNRPNDTVRIEVHQLILGAEGKFVAVPVQLPGMFTSRNELQIQASSEFEALESLIGQIENLPYDEIFPKSE